MKEDSCNQVHSSHLTGWVLQTPRTAQKRMGSCLSASSPDHHSSFGFTTTELLLFHLVSPGERLQNQRINTQTFIPCVSQIIPRKGFQAATRGTEHPGNGTGPGDTNSREPAAHTSGNGYRSFSVWWSWTSVSIAAQAIVLSFHIVLAFPLHTL